MNEQTFQDWLALISICRLTGGRNLNGISFQQKIFFGEKMLNQFSESKGKIQV